jgi:transcriptional regulator
VHPNPTFEWIDRPEMLQFVAEQAFAQIFCSGASGLAVVHAPVIVTDEGAVRFHVAKRNRAASQIGSNRVLLSIVGRHAYQSASWYVSESQVPTWHYEAVEIEGQARELDDKELVELVDQLSDTFEQRHSPERPWNRSKMKLGSFEAMLNGIVGFEIVPDQIRGTRKFNQHKSDEDRAATVAGLQAAGFGDVASAVLEFAPQPKDA